MVNDANVSLEDRWVRLDHTDGGFSRLPKLFMLLDVCVVSVPGRTVEAPIVHEKQAGAQEKHEKYGYPMALPQRYKQMRIN